MDTKLPWYQRLAVRFHLLYCVWCRRYTHQVQFLRKAASKVAGETDEVGPAKLSDEAKEHIRQKLAEAMNERRPPE
jgi:hypothetical protein